MSGVEITLGSVWRSKSGVSHIVGDVTDVDRVLLRKDASTARRWVKRTTLLRDYKETSKRAFLGWTSAKEETFQLWRYVFDISKAKQILKSAPRMGDSAAVMHLVEFLAKRADGSLQMGISIDWDKIRSTPESFDLDVPIIFGQWFTASKELQVFPLDGWHRIGRADLAEVEALPSVSLSLKETRSIML